MRLPIHVSAVQYATECDNNTANTDRAIHLLDDAAHTSDLILLPESSFTCHMPADGVRKHTQTVRGPLSAIVSQIAVTRNACACFCIPERDGDRVYETAILICADGGILGTHRKIHLNHLDKAAGFSAGDSLDVSNTYLGRVGMLISDDALNVSNAVALGDQGAQVILIPSAVFADTQAAVDPSLKTWEDLLRTCALESHCYVVWANKIGAEDGRPAIGNSMIIGPDGKTIARADMMEEVVRAQIILHGLSRAA